MPRRNAIEITKAIGPLRIVILFLTSYAIFYYAYKFYIPNIGGGSDFYKYKKMILEPLSLDAAKAPFVFRQFGSVIANLIYQSGLYYDAEISYECPETEKRIFFAAILSNYFALLTAAYVSSLTVDRLIGKIYLSYGVLSGLMLFLSFGTLAYTLTGLMEGWTLAFIAFGFYALVKKDIYIYAFVLALSIFQKETISIIMLAMSIPSLSRRKSMHEVSQAITWIGLPLLAFSVYIALRTLILKVPGYENQTNVHAMLGAAKTFGFSYIFIIKVFLSQNLSYVLVILLSLILAIENGKQKIPRADLMFGLIFSYIALTFAGILANIGNNVGRILLNLAPITCCLISYYIYHIEAGLQSNQLRNIVD
jgi:hypothetical protein